MWTGIEFSSQDYVALLMCLANGGFHSLASYQWSQNGSTFVGEVYPLLYTRLNETMSVL